jgi:hypothetical protein
VRLVGDGFNSSVAKQNVDAIARVIDWQPRAPTSSSTASNATYSESG